MILFGVCFLPCYHQTQSYSTNGYSSTIGNTNSPVGVRPSNLGGENLIDTLIDSLGAT